MPLLKGDPETPFSSDLEAARSLIGGVWFEGSNTFDTHDPFRDIPFGRVPESTYEEVHAAVAAAKSAKPEVARTSARHRADLLQRVASLINERSEILALTMSRETGKAIADSRREVSRSAETLLLSAQEAVRIEGSHVPMDATEQGSGKLGISLRFPVGVVAAITPFNAPLNLACHKLGPAIAAGNSIVLKPAPQASVTVHKLVEIFQDAGTPPGWLNVVYGVAAGAHLVQSSDIDAVSFTGSSHVGAKIRQSAPLKPMTLELGGNGTTVVCKDADIAAAANICATAAMRLAGQSCISVQNVCVDRTVVDAFEKYLLDRVQQLHAGDPLDESSDLGPLISKQSADRVVGIVEDAAARGGSILLGGGRTAALIQPTVLRLSSAIGRVFEDEVFGPVVNIIAFDDMSEAFQWINASRFGLQAGVFTSSIDNALRAARSLRVGAVILNGSSTWRSDQAPYGGIKDSGAGREGPRYAIREMTHERFIVFNH